MTLDGSGSSDPDGDPLTYLWDFGDGSPTAQTSSPTTTHTYASAGTFTARPTVRDDAGATSPAATARIDVGNTAPQPVITTPAAGQRFAVGETIALRGSATDAQDGTLPASALDIGGRPPPRIPYAPVGQPVQRQQRLVHLPRPPRISPRRPTATSS